MIKKIVIISLLFTLALSACAAARSSEPPFTGSDMAGGGEAGAPVEASEDFEMPAAEYGLNDVERIVIKNASLSIAVIDPAATLENISLMAEQMGGFVVSSQLYRTVLENGLEVPRAKVTVRVPAARLTEAMEQIKSGAGQVLSENTSGEDVTRDYTDLQSRLRNLEDAETRLREIMASANKTEDVLAVHNQLTQIREQIELTKGQIQYYEQSAAFSAISVDIMTDEAAKPLMIGGWEPVGVAKDAVQALIDGLQFLGTAAIWIALFFLPIGLVIGLPIYLVVRALRRRRASKKTAPAPEKADT